MEEDSLLTQGLSPSKEEVSLWIERNDSEQDKHSSESTGHDFPDNVVTKYFEKKKIKMLFDFMVQHLIINEPDYPIEYLKDLADKLLMWRSGTVSKAPQLFEERHVEAIYKALDPAGQGLISLEQYHSGFKTLMLEKYPLYPELNEETLVEKKTFIENALKALDENLMNLVRPPYKNLCELTILPDESYDVLFRDYSSKDTSTVALAPTEKTDEKDSNVDSCQSSTTCVHLEPKELDVCSNCSEISFVSEDEVSLGGFEAYDFLVRRSFDNEDLRYYSTVGRRGTIQGSKITLLGGRIGENAKMLLDDEDMSLETLTLQSLSKVK